MEHKLPYARAGWAQVHKLCSIPLNPVQCSTALHTPQPGTAAHGLPLTPGPSRWSRARLAPAQTQQMMLIRECRTLGRPGCSFCSEASPCFLIKYLQLQKRQNSVQILTARFMCGKNPKERKKRKKRNHNISLILTESRKKRTQWPKNQYDSRVWEIEQNVGANKHCLIHHGDNKQSSTVQFNFSQYWSGTVIFRPDQQVLPLTTPAC